MTMENGWGLLMNVLAVVSQYCRYQQVDGAPELLVVLADLL